MPEEHANKADSRPVAQRSIGSWLSLCWPRPAGSIASLSIYTAYIDLRPESCLWLGRQECPLQTSGNYWHPTQAHPIVPWAIYRDAQLCLVWGWTESVVRGETWLSTGVHSGSGYFQRCHGQDSRSHGFWDSSGLFNRRSFLLRLRLCWQCGSAAGSRCATLISALSFFEKEASELGLYTNWLKTEVQSLDDFLPRPPNPNGSKRIVEVVEKFQCLGVLIHESCDSSLEIDPAKNRTGPKCV